MAVPQFEGMLEAREVPHRRHEKTKKNEKKSLMVAQELKIARALAGNDKPMRHRALKSLRRWFHHRPQNLPFTEEDFLRLWKGLFYSIWMSDKPLVQEECAENIASLLHELPLDNSLELFKCGLITLINEWFGIDQLRLDKFMMFVRRLLRQALFVLKKSSLNKSTIIQFGEILNNTILDLKKKDAMGLFLHFTEIFWEELAKVTEGSLRPDLVNDFLTPFIKCLATADDARIIKHLKRFVFIHLIIQTNVGLEYQEKYNAWKKEGFPGSIHAMHKVDTNENDSNADATQENSDEYYFTSSLKDRPLDPRAGRVDVELSQIKFHPKAVAELLLKYKYIDGTTVATRKAITLLAKQFRQLAHGTYPLGVTNMKLPKSEVQDMKLKKAVNKLVKFEKKLLHQDSGFKKRKLKESKVEKNPKRQKLKDEIEEINQQVYNTDHFDKKLENFVKGSKSDLQLTKKIGISPEKPSLFSQKDVGTKRNVSSVETNIFNVETPLKKIRRSFNISQSQPESVFKRNSGLWLVYNQDESDISGFLDNSSADLGNFLEDKIEHLSYITNVENSDGGGITPESILANKITPIKKSDQKKFHVQTSFAESALMGKCMKIETKSPEDSFTGKDGLPLEKKETENCSNPNTSTKELFPKNQWDEPMEEGEYDICIPSKSYVEKLRRISRKSTLNVQELIINSLGKSRHSLDFKKGLNCSTPQSAKKVKINTRLNQSQEFHEYHSQILSSPAITFDASKKPGKPLLKTASFNYNSVNPFYKQLCDF